MASPETPEQKILDRLNKSAAHFEADVQDSSKVSIKLDKTQEHYIATAIRNNPHLLKDALGLKEDAVLKDGTLTLDLKGADTSEFALKMAETLGNVLTDPTAQKKLMDIETLETEVNLHKQRGPATTRASRDKLPPESYTLPDDLGNIKIGIPEASQLQAGTVKPGGAPQPGVIKGYSIDLDSLHLTKRETQDADGKSNTTFSVADEDKLKPVIITGVGTDNVKVSYANKDGTANPEQVAVDTVIDAGGKLMQVDQKGKLVDVKIDGIPVSGLQSPTPSPRAAEPNIKVK